jgi:hypothetical protein
MRSEKAGLKDKGMILIYKVDSLADGQGPIFIVMQL